jgi:hypothetical protein
MWSCLASAEAPGIQVALMVGATTSLIEPLFYQVATAVLAPSSH